MHPHRDSAWRQFTATLPLYTAINAQSNKQIKLHNFVTIIISLNFTTSQSPFHGTGNNKHDAVMPNADTDQNNH